MSDDEKKSVSLAMVLERIDTNLSGLINLMIADSGYTEEGGPPNFEDLSFENLVAASEAAGAIKVHKLFRATVSRIAEELTDEKE